MSLRAVVIVRPKQSPRPGGKMDLEKKFTWRSPEEIVEIAFERASVMMMNEAHNGWKRCIRTRQIGQRIFLSRNRLGCGIWRWRH
jgi:hypothetical protein